MVLCPPTGPIPPAPIVRMEGSSGRARTDAEMFRDVLGTCKADYPESPLLLIKAGGDFPLWISQPEDLVWKYQGEVSVTLWLGCQAFNVPVCMRLLVFRPMLTSEFPAETKEGAP